MKIAVVGLGYVGLPLTIRLSQLNFDVSAIDINSEKIEKLQRGILPFAQDEPRLKEYFKKEYSKEKMTFSCEFTEVRDCALVFINVDTPILDKNPNYSSLISALKSISNFLKKGSIVIIESTVAPKTTEDLVIPTIEKYSKLRINKDFFVATVPERIRPNHIFEQLTTLPRVIGVSDKSITAKLKNIYSKITSGGLDFTDVTTAEVVKVAENTYRDVNIAFANELALACEELGVNVYKIRELINKSRFHDLHMPGAGVGGHCIPKDPWLLVSSVAREELGIVIRSRQVNDSMPQHMFDLIKLALAKSGISPQNSKVAILGFSFVEDTDDSRNSPTQSLVEILRSKKIKFKIHDPFVVPYKNSKLEDVIKGSDCLVLMVAHGTYKKLDPAKFGKLMRNKIIIDGRNFFDAAKARKLGFLYKGVGNV